MKKFAFLLMGAHYNPDMHHADFLTEKQLTRIATVRDFDQAQRLVLQLKDEGFGAIELCGAFGEAGARQLADLTGGQMAIGYVTHTQEMDEKVSRFFEGGAKI